MMDSKLDSSDGRPNTKVDIALEERELTTVLVTGGLGTIGNRMVPLLRQHGYDVKILTALREFRRADSRLVLYVLDPKQMARMRGVEGDEGG